MAKDKKLCFGSKVVEFANANKALLGVSKASYRTKNEATLRRGFFYRHGMDCKKFADEISAKLTEQGIAHKVVAWGEVFKPFHGGLPIEKQTHWWVVVGDVDSNDVLKETP